MAVAFVRNHTGAESASGTSVSFTTAAAVPIGNLLAVWIGMDNTGTSTPTVSSITKHTGETNSWAKVASHDSSTATSAGGCRGELWVIKTTVQWPTATAFTATLSASPPKSHTNPREFSGVLTTLRGTAGTGTSTVGTPSAVSAGTAPVSGDLALGGATFETSTTPTADSDTTNGSWDAGQVGSSTGGATAAQLRSIVQYKIVTGTSAQTYNPTANSTDSGSAVVILQADTAIPLDGHADVANSAGSSSLTASRPLASHGDVANGASGDVTITRGLAGKGDVANYAGADLTVTAGGGTPQAIDGHGDVANSAGGALTVTRPLSSHADVATDGSGALTATRSIAGKGDAAAHATGALSVATLLSGSAPVSATTMGSLTVTPAGPITHEPAADIYAGGIVTARQYAGGWAGHIRV